MDATQMISDSILEDEEEDKEENENKRGRPLAKLCILKNEHIPENELPLFLGDNVLGRDPNTCTLPLPAPSISKQHATICISVYKRRGRYSGVDIEALIWDLGSMNGTRKGHLKLTPNVRYALSEQDTLVVADIPCQYVSCTTDTVSSQEDMMTPVSRNSGVNARLPDPSGEKGGDPSTGIKKCVNGGSKARVSLPNQEDTGKTPVRTSCLSFEKTPTQPEGTLVPESDSDSDTERGDRRRKALVTDSDSHKSGPTCSTFLSPTNKIVPESEDESPITPCSSTKNRPYRHVSFSKEEPDVEVVQQQLKNKKTLEIVDDSEEEEERAALGGGKSEESGQHVSGKQESNVSPTGEDDLPVSSPAVCTDAIPAFDMDSDTDMEGEEERGASAFPVNLNTNQQADQPPNTAQFQMDSDTDVDEDALHEVPKSVPSSADHTKLTQPEGITMDSDTDVDDDDAVSDAAIKAKPTPLQSTHAADSSLSTQQNDLHLDSDTDVDEEEEEKQSGTNNACPKIDETPTRLDIKPTGTESAPAASHSLHLDSDTDDEAIPLPAIGDLSVVSAVTESVTTADAGADLGVLSDSDTDVDDDSPLVIPVNVSTLSLDPGTSTDSNADTDVDESSVPPAGDGVNPADLRVDSDTDVEDLEVDFGEAGENQIPSLRRENTPGLLVPLQQNCSTPVQGSEGGLEEMETQGFLIPSSGPFIGARPIALSPCSASLEDDSCFVAETQSFILQTRDCQGNPPEDPIQSSGVEKGKQSIRGGSFQLGLSDSSHLEGQAQALAMENTQAFVPVAGGMNLEDTQAYADRTSSPNDLNRQADREDEEPARCSEISAKEGRVDFDLEATQAYISEPYSDSEDETDEDERKKTASAETQPFDLPTSSTLAMAETLPFAFEEEERRKEECLDKENPISSVLEVKSSPQHVAEEREKHVEAAQPQKRHLSDALSVAETQPMHVSEDEESDDEDLIPRKRKAKPLQLEDEQSQTLTNSELSLVETQPTHIGVAETQPIAASGSEESDDEDSITAPRKRKAKQLRLEDEQTQTLTNSELSTAATQPMETGEDGESDEEDFIPSPRKRRAKPLQPEEESQPLAGPGGSVFETQPMGTCAEDKSDEEVSTPGPRKRNAKALQLEEEETQPLSISEVSAVETQPMVAGEDGESDDEESIQGPRKRRAKAKPIQEEDTQPLTSSEASIVETKTALQPRRGKGRETEAGTSGTSVGGRRLTRTRLREEEEEEEEQAECSEPPKRQTRGKMNALPTTRGRRGKPRPDEEESEEEEEVEKAKRARGKRYTRQRKDSEEEEEMLETERNKHPENNNLLKEQEEGRKEQDKLERERKEKEEQERVQAENAERLKLEQERAEKERIEREKSEEDEKKRADTAQKEKEEHLERERKEKEEKERLERERAERKEKERLEKEREKEERERLGLEKAKREEERIEKEREKEERVRLEHEKAEREEKERVEKERERFKRKKAEREEKEREAKERTEKERKDEEEEKERLKTAEREREEGLEKERKEQEHQARLERDAKEREEGERLETEKQAKEKQTKGQEENEPKTSARGQRAARRTFAATEPQPDSTISASDDVPARRTRSRSNSSNSVSSERSASSVNTQGSRGRGRGRGARRTSGPPEAAIARGSSSRRRSVAAESTQQDSYDSCPRGVLSRSNSTNSEISSCSLSSQSRGRGGRQRGRGRKTESDSIPPMSSQSGQNLAPKPTARGRNSRRAEESSYEVPHEDELEKADSQQAGTTRGRQQANANGSKPAAGDKKSTSSQECASEESPMSKRNVRGRSQKAVKSETVETPVAPGVSDGEEPKEKRKGSKRQLEANAEEGSSSSSKISKGKEKAQTTEAEEGEAKGETKDEIRVQATRKGRASSAQAKKNAKDSPAELEGKEESEETEEGTIVRRGRGRPSAVHKLKKEKQEEGGTSVDQDPHVEASQPQTPTSSGSRKRQALADSSPVAKTPRSSSASPSAGGQLRAVRQSYKVLFTGVVDEEGERVLARLGGSMAKGVADMNCLVTDKVRRTVKFLCAVAKGVPIVTTHWLDKSGKAGSFLSPNAFVVKDPEQEKKFNFCLQESLKIASSQLLLQGYGIHVTKSVKPEPVHMKDIISSSGATFLPKMPSSHKPQTVVIACEEDWPLCGPALSASLPVVTAEFILTGILQQKLDLQKHKLSAPANTLLPAGGRGRSRKKT
ncbi:LOW QUALITY PROTEIN: mediator of DNA damage checkpoint protein 1 [Anoplopoma fimbria]|uniref:LOW QUALITY PROTEIN: mediator of DNA damage checkpoint protein 1 n=1 Tax=Anoplopoma fimbria TaxID=229290 RepID=UPI0023EB8996|nr:LOW QUALITY PROTEIN: mediator of DNA damage checkpoint protein 1 [Anoplopoma fimbria]